MGIAHKVYRAIHSLLLLTSEELQVLSAAVQDKEHCTGGQDTGGKLPTGDVQHREVQELNVYRHTHTHTEVVTLRQRQTHSPPSLGRIPGLNTLEE